MLVERIHPPYSYQSPAQFFPRSTEVWDLKASVKHVTIQPATEDVATGGVPVQPRGHHWRPTGRATIVWIEALDGGEPTTDDDDETHDEGGRANISDLLLALTKKTKKLDCWRQPQSTGQPFLVRCRHIVVKVTVQFKG